jgi:conjugative relaxase-like TrwC/TraI family protein
MIRINPVASARKAEDYYAKTDGGYYLKPGDLHREWGGQGAARLGLAGPPDFEQFKRLVHGRHPFTGERLTARLDADRLPAWDVTASVPKGVTTALERGDSRIQGAIWEAGREAMALLEGYAATRVRGDGRHEDRRTGNLVWYAVEHPDTRPTEEDNMTDWDRHIHFVVFNGTFDPAERRWKALKVRRIFELRKYFDRCFDTLLAGKLAGELGYEVETQWKDDPKGGRRYYSWDIKGIPDSVLDKFSRRTREVDQVERAIVAERKEAARRQGDPLWDTLPDHLSAVARDKLGATSRRQKRDDLTLEDYRAYWNGRITPEEGREIAETIKRAMLGQNPRPEPALSEAVGFALRHHFEKQSAVPLEHLATTAMERSMGRATPAEIEREAIRQGVLVAEIDGRRMATTPALQREEEFIAGFAARGLGQAEAVGVPRLLPRGPLNDGQWRAVTGLLASPNRVNLVEGPAGAGKSSLLKGFDRGMHLAGQQVTYLASTSDAAEELAREGFAAKTVAHFLLDERMQQAARGGRVVVDEAGMLGHRDAYRLFALAKALDLKLVFVGDPMQHGSVPRGELMRLLKEYGDVKPFRLTEIMRQKHADDPRYGAAVKLLSQGRTLDGFDAIDGMGWVRQVRDDGERYEQVAADYLRALADRKSVLVVSPTHAEAARITAEIRSRLKAAGRLGPEEREFTRLVAVDASEAERGLAATYRPGDVLVFHEAAKGFKKGQRVIVADPARVPLAEAGAFSLYRPATIALAAGDKIRFTGTVEARDGRKLKNGHVRTVAGFTPGGNIRLDNGMVIRADAVHYRHGYVETSFGAQGRTVQRAILAVSSVAAAAISRQMLYVGSSRAREWMRIYTDDRDDLRDAVVRDSAKVLALDLRPRRAGPSAAEHGREHHERRRRWAFLGRLRAAWDAAARQPARPWSRPTPHAERALAPQRERGTAHER